MASSEVIIYQANEKIIHIDVVPILVKCFLQDRIKKQIQAVMVNGKTNCTIIKYKDVFVVKEVKTKNIVKIIRSYTPKIIILQAYTWLTVKKYVDISSMFAAFLSFQNSGIKKTINRHELILNTPEYDIIFGKNFINK